MRRGPPGVPCMHFMRDMCFIQSAVGGVLRVLAAALDGVPLGPASLLAAVLGVLERPPLTALGLPANLCGGRVESSRWCRVRARLPEAARGLGRSANAWSGGVE